MKGKYWMKNEISSAGNLIKIIENSRNNALKKVNEELIRMYWGVGEYLSKEAENAAFGDAYIDSVVKEIQSAFPGIKGFNRRGLYRMKQFYETYCRDEFVLALLTQISWTTKRTESCTIQASILISCITINFCLTFWGQISLRGWGGYFFVIS